MSDIDVSGDSTAVPVWRERKNLILAGAVGVAVLLIAGYFVLSGGSSNTATGPVVPSHANAAGADGGGSVSSAAATPSAATTVPALYRGDVYGNPFKPLFPPAATPAAAMTTAATTTGTSTTTNTSTNTSTTPSTSAPKTTTKPKSSTQTSSIKLAKVVDDNTVSLYLNGSKVATTYDIGKPFGTYFVLVSTRPDEGEATFSYGDGSLFTLDVGQSKTFVD